MPDGASTIEFTLNDRPVAAQPGESILQAADRLGVPIPRLCYTDGMRADGNCRACVVEIDGERVLAPSCCRAPKAGMVVRTDSPRATHSQKMVLELLASDMPPAPYRPDSELEHWAQRMAIGRPRFAPRRSPDPDLSHPAIAVNLDACIQCTRCVRACRESQVNDVIGFAFRGAHAEIVFDLGDPMGKSTCVACGECVQACPTGALMPARGAGAVAADRTVDSVCPYCGVGCQLTYHIKDEKIVRVEGRDGLANRSRLCVKGRYGFDYVDHPQRLTKPLIRRDDAPKSADFTMDPNDVGRVFREATWEEALDRAGGTLRAIRDSRGPQALAGFGSAKGSNEEAYLFQKLVRTGFRTNNVDHCTRLCHASSVAALLEGIGSGAVSNPVLDVLKAEVVLLIGANPVVNHPVAATWIKNAVKQRHEADPRRPAPLRARPPRDALPAVQARHRRRAAQRDDARDRRGRPHRPGVHRRAHRRLCRAEEERRGLQPRGDGAAVRHPGGDDPRGRAPVRHVEGLDDPVGDGHLAAHPRHRQRALPDRAVADDRPDRPPRHGAASAARAEQRAGRVRLGLDPDDVSRLPARRESRRAREIRAPVGDEARPQAGPHRGRDHGRRARRHDSRHVHHGREPGDVGSRRAARARRAGPSRVPGRAGHLPHRDRVPRRRRSSRRPRSRRNPARSPTPTAWCSSAGRRCSRPARRGRTWS